MRLIIGGLWGDAGSVAAVVVRRRIKVPRNFDARVHGVAPSTFL